MFHPRNVSPRKASFFPKKIELSIGVRCPHCEKVFRSQVSAYGGMLCCPNCKGGKWDVASSENIFDVCTICRGKKFFRQKDFNKFLGLIVVISAAFFVPQTYGLSMLLAFLIDFALYKRTPEMVRCYTCHSEYRQFPIPDRVRLYDHYQAEMLEKNR